MSNDIQQQTNTKPIIAEAVKNRFAYIDNLKAFLIISVIIVHVGVT